MAIEHALVANASEYVVVGAQSLDHEQCEQLQLCKAVLQEQPRPILTRYWGGEEADRLFDQIEQAFWQIHWRNATLYLLEASWSTACGGEHRKWVIAETRRTADEFILDVERQTNDPGEAILVFRRH